MSDKLLNTFAAVVYLTLWLAFVFKIVCQKTMLYIKEKVSLWPELFTFSINFPVS